MWYYEKDGTKCGPVSGGAVRRLFAERAIDANTKVWSPEQKIWLRYADSSLSQSSENRDRIFELKKYTYPLRALLASLAVCVGLKTFFLCQTLGMHKVYVAAKTPAERLETTIQSSEIGKLESLSALAIFALLCAAAFAVFKWLGFVSKYARRMSPSYEFSESANWLFFIPLANLLAPQKIAASLVNASQDKRHTGVWDFCVLTLWKFFWPAAIVLVAAANYLIPSRCAPFEIEPYIYARILVQAVYISTILLTLGVVSTVFRLQLAYFKRRMR